MVPCVLRVVPVRATSFATARGAKADGRRGRRTSLRRKLSVECISGDGSKRVSRARCKLYLTKSRWVLVQRCGFNYGTSRSPDAIPPRQR